MQVVMASVLLTFKWMRKNEEFELYCCNSKIIIDSLSQIDNYVNNKCIHFQKSREET